jgi:hypothetical protein
MYGRDKKLIEVLFSEKTEDKSLFERHRLRVKIILEWILKKEGV